MRRFLAGVSEANAEIDALGNTLREMDGAARRVSGAATAAETKTLREELAALREDFVAGMRASKAGIESLKKKAAEGATEREKHLREQHVKSLIERAKRLVEHFSTAQSEFCAEERERLKSQYVVARPAATKEELEDLEYKDSPSPFAFAKKPEAETHERKKSLREITAGITQVTQMTEQLNILVHRSERNVDKITITTAKTEVKAKKADRDLKKALDYQRLARLAKIVALSVLGALLLAMLFLAVGFVVFLVVVLARNLQSSDALPSRGGARSGGAGRAPAEPAALAGSGSNPQSAPLRAGRARSALH